MTGDLVISSLSGFFSKPAVRIIIFLVIMGAAIAALLYMYDTWENIKLTKLNIDLRTIELQKAKQNTNP